MPFSFICYLAYAILLSFLCYFFKILARPNNWNISEESNKTWRYYHKCMIALSPGTNGPQIAWKSDPRSHTFILSASLCISNLFSSSETSDKSTLSLPSSQYSHYTSRINIFLCLNIYWAPIGQAWVVWGVWCNHDPNMGCSFSCTDYGPWVKKYSFVRW